MGQGIKLFVLILVFILCAVNRGLSQSKYKISFAETANVIKSKTADVILKVFLKTTIGSFKDSAEYKILITPDRTKSSLDSSLYSVSLGEKPFTLLSDVDSSVNVVLLTVKKDSIAKGAQTIILKMEIKKGSVQDSVANNGGRFQELKIIVNDPVSSVESVGYSVTLLDPGALSRRKTSDNIIPVFMKASLGKYKDSINYKVSVEADFGNPDFDLPSSAFQIDFQERSLHELDTQNVQSNKVFLTLKKDSLLDRKRKLILKVLVRKDGKVVNTEKFEFSINEIKTDTVLKAYKYLAYVGTNFDLVDGVRASNLFFATNIFLPPIKQKSIGYYLSLYGNRTMISSDSTPELRRTVKVVAMSDTTSKYFTQQMSLVRTTQSDNLGAFCSPLFPIWQLSQVDNQLKLYFAPTLEFVWRRTHLEYQYSNGRFLDSTIQKERVSGTIEYSNSYKTDASEFVFNYGLGLMLVHESENISVRVHGSVGCSSNYSPITSGLTKGDLSGNPTPLTYQTAHDTFFTGRAWITEAITGITLQAEVTNTIKNPRPFYGVTLSKAFDFRNIGNIFQPIIKK